MKRYILNFAAVLLFGTMAFAQAGAPPADAPAGARPRRGHHGQMDPQKHFDRMAKQLNLTEDQKAKIKPIFEQARTDSQNLRTQKLTVDERREKMKSIHDNAMSQMRAVLTPEQQTKFDDMQKKMQERRADRMAKHGRRGQGGAPNDSQQPPQ